MVLVPLYFNLILQPQALLWTLPELSSVQSTPTPIVCSTYVPLARIILAEGIQVPIVRIALLESTLKDH